MYCTAQHCTWDGPPRTASIHSARSNTAAKPGLQASGAHQAQLDALLTGEGQLCTEQAGGSVETGLQLQRVQRQGRNIAQLDGFASCSTHTSL